MVTTYIRGHLVYYKNNKWYYADNNEECNDQRPCKKCGHYPTKEGYDYCLGYIHRSKISLLWARNKKALYYLLI